MTLSWCSATRRSASGVMSWFKAWKTLAMAAIAYFGIQNTDAAGRHFEFVKKLGALCTISFICTTQSHLYNWYKICRTLYRPGNKVYLSVRTAAYGTTKSTCLYVPLCMAQQSLHVRTYGYVWHNKVYLSVRTAAYGTWKSTCLYVPLRMAQQCLYVRTYGYVWHNKFYMSARTATYGTTKSICLYVPVRTAQQSLHVLRTGTYGTTKSTCPYVRLCMPQQSLHVCTYR